MEKGLLWLPLLVLFFWLAWAGWNEYCKVEVYRLWAEDFERSKYDIYAVLGQKQTDLTWGKPTRKGIIDRQTVSLKDIKKISLLVDRQLVMIDNLPSKGKATIALYANNQSAEILIPFTDIDLAARWMEFLQKEVKVLQNE
jgi:hypothetical protein